jgi:acetyl-CoA synthetase
MEAEKVYKVGENSLSLEDYHKKYKRSIEDNEGFWKEEGLRIDWIKPYTKIRDFIYSKEKTEINWFSDGTLNMSYNCIDRHIEKGKGQEIALIWEGNDSS